MNFLTNKYIHSNDGKFACTDTSELFKKNLKVMPDNWHYKTKNVNYKCNKFKYRTYEFENIYWNKSIVVFGCSNVFGSGIDEEETLSYYIEKLTGISTINMGMPGSSIYHSYYNLLTLFEMNVQPIAIINVYPSLDRLIYYDKNYPVSLGHWVLLNDTAEEHFINLYKSWTNDDSNFIGHSRLLQRSLTMLIKDLKYFECSYNPNSAISLGIPPLSVCDKARDLLHPGFESNKKNASFIVQSLRL